MTEESGGAGRKIAIVEPLGDGGIAHYTYNLIQALRASGITPLLFTAKRFEFSGRDWPEGSLYRSFFGFTFLLIRKFPWLDLEREPAGSLRRLLKLMEFPFDTLRTIAIARRCGCRILHLQTVNWIDILVAVSARFCGLKVVITIHNVNPGHGELRPCVRTLLSLKYKLAAGLIVHTAAGKREISELYGIDGDRCVVIPHGDYGFFATGNRMEPAQARARLGIPPDSPSLLFFGAIRPNKGLDVLLRSMPKIREFVPGVRLMVVGEPVGPYRPYRDLIGGLGIGDMICEVLRYVDVSEVADYFQAADVAVLPYREITQSGVLQIAFAFARPVVASALDGFIETLDDGVEGILVPAEDPDSLANACVELLKNPERARRMGAAGHEKMEREYSWTKIAQRTHQEVYEVVSRL